MTGNLKAKIDEMFAKGLVRDLVKDAAHEIRFIGNETAHGDFIASITAEETDEVLELMTEVLEEVYQAPARLAARRAARQARTQSGP